MFSPVMMGMRVARRSAIQLADHSGASGSSKNKGLMDSTACATLIALGTSSSQWQCTSMPISSPNASRARV